MEHVDLRPTQRSFLGLFPQAHDAALIEESIDVLRLRHCLAGKRLHIDHLHITVHSLAHYGDAAPLALIDATKAAAATVEHPPLDTVLE